MLNLLSLDTATVQRIEDKSLFEQAGELVDLPRLIYISKAT